MTQEEFLKNVHKRVFWDCVQEELDLEKDINFIITRVLMRGIDSEIRFIESQFTTDEILYAVNNCPEADKICRNFYKSRKEYLENL